MELLEVLTEQLLEGFHRNCYMNVPGGSTGESSKGLAEVSPYNLLE